MLHKINWSQLPEEREAGDKEQEEELLPRRDPSVAVSELVAALALGAAAAGVAALWLFCGHSEGRVVKAGRWQATHAGLLVHVGHDQPAVLRIKAIVNMETDSFLEALNQQKIS